MKKRIISIALGSVLVLSMSSTAVFVEHTRQSISKDVQLGNQQKNSICQSQQAAITCGWPWTAKTKTVKKNYNYPDVPASIDYTEYIDGKWYSGELSRTGDVVKISDNIWQATYTGKINY